MAIGEPTSSATDDTILNELEGRFIELDFEVHKSIRYQVKRRSFFDNCNTLTRAATAIFSAGAVVSIVGGRPDVAAGVAAGLAVLSSIDLVVDFSRRAREYDARGREFSELSANMEEVVSWNEELLHRFSVRKLRIEANEPKALDVLNVVCANDELEARGYTYKYRVRLFQRALKHFVSLPPFDFPKVHSRVAEITARPGPEA